MIAGQRQSKPFLLRQQKDAQRPVGRPSLQRLHYCFVAQLLQPSHLTLG